jgi:hypothetical protein
MGKTELGRKAYGRTAHTVFSVHDLVHTHGFNVCGPTVTTIFIRKTRWLDSLGRGIRNELWDREI